VTSPAIPAPTTATCASILFISVSSFKGCL